MKKKSNKKSDFNICNIQKLLDKTNEESWYEISGDSDYPDILEKKHVQYLIDTIKSGLYIITEDDIKKINSWQKSKKHIKCHKRYAGAIGGQYSYEFTPTSIGTVFKIKCSICNNELNLTNYENW